MPTIVKVGGSLFDLPGLGATLDRWLAEAVDGEVILVPGGGAAAEAVRHVDRVHQLGEERSHWLALRALSLNAAVLAAILPRAVLVEDLDVADLAGEQGHRPVLDPFVFSEEDEQSGGHLPHTWAVTSDSVAARVAVVSAADELVLLKSAAPPAGGVAEWATAGYVDAWLPKVVAADEFAVRAVNLRSWQPRS